MNTFIISIGSNEDSEKNVTQCRVHLLSLFDAIYFSATSITKPFGKQYRSDFLNQLAFIKTHESLETTKEKLKQIEIKMGRKKEDKGNGIVKIDIDIIKWNDRILKEKDWQRNYVTDLLASLYEAVSV